MNVYEHISKVKLATVVEGDSKAPFLIATTPCYRWGPNFIPWIAPLYPYLIMLSVRSIKVALNTIFWIFDITRPGIEPRSPGPLANTLLNTHTHTHTHTHTQIHIYIYIYIYIHIYIYILKCVYWGSKLLFKQVLLKTMEFCLLFFILFFSSLFVIFNVSGSRW